MKVFLVTNKLNRKNREIELCKIVNGFKGEEDYEFFAFATKEEGMESDIIRFLPAHSGDGVDDLLPYIRLAAGEERCFIVYEEYAIPLNPDKMLHSHKSAQCGITVLARPTLCGWRNGGVLIIESDYLDLAEFGTSLEGDIIVRCAEDGEMNVVKR